MASRTETTDLTMPHPAPATPLFDDAVAAIRNSIMREHSSYFQSNATAASLMDELRRVSVGNGAADPTVVACSRKLVLFIRAFAPYFDVLSTCITLRPEWVHWFWGAVRLVVKISSDYLLLLEKAADMFEAIAHVLPPYQHMYNASSQHTAEPYLKEEDGDLATLLSHVYADLVQLFLEIYRIFCRGTQAHAVSWRPLDSRLTRLEVRLGKHRRWLERETQNHVQQYADVSHYRKQYLDFLRNQERIRASDIPENEGQRTAKRWRRVEKARSWLCSSSALSQVDRRPEPYNPDSCAWFLQTSVYCKWRNRPFEKTVANDADFLVNSWQHRVLFIQAQVGFGKTLISHSVIDNLVAEAEDPDFCGEPPAIAYYHFNRLHSEHNNPDDAFRAIACQLLQAHHNDHSTLDAVCLLLRKTSFREHATTDEVMNFLALLLRQHPTYLVIDGIDECIDMEGFLTLLARLCRVSDTRVILFSRPDLKIPLEYQKWASDAPHIFALTSQHNSAAIEGFLAPELNRLADQGFFGISMDRTLIPQLTQTANGEFLWASMLLRFLQSPILSSEERVTVILHTQSLQGLGPLYRTMLDALARHSQHKKRIITDCFRWLSHGIHRMEPAALRAALCTYDAEISETHTVDIVNALDELTCGLLLIKDDSILFAHESVCDFLQSPHSHDSEFSLYDESSVHAHLAANCLSYLAYDIPKRPLGALQPHIPPTPPVESTSSSASQRTMASADSGYKSLSSSDVDNNNPVASIVPTPRNNSRASSIRTVPFDTQLPFLRYAALFWPIHLSRALSLSSHHSTALARDTLAYLPALGAFLSSRFAVTSWVEASFRYNLPPTLTRLIGPLSDLKGEISPSTTKGRELRLAREYESIMRQNPSLIWQMDEPGAEHYWPVWEDVIANGSMR
ncbi:uncharacterized protein SETTUDRAFT_170945 [Exserohilum turcica Et28A]|uniref:Nephrocystin 3-like N-terminal domain-containing protein n=1 Tax=Exserohilum turcicum (strain 28A) TaxID=671987 RepID=R0KHJ3_EXST2|nr:uncharacterized protein SETTUDRAFT_170945 [Exserohilum turcica Et28A]EOA92353.1 hypothetical protein SETTUDRAFT_170945 [Exserohilum turcica Et28A]